MSPRLPRFSSVIQLATIVTSVWLGVHAVVFGPLWLWLVALLLSAATGEMHRQQLRIVALEERYDRLRAVAREWLLKSWQNELRSTLVCRRAEQRRGTVQ